MCSELSRRLKLLPFHERHIVMKAGVLTFPVWKSLARKEPGLENSPVALTFSLI